MPLCELKLEYISEKKPHKDKCGRLVIDRAPEITWDCASVDWERVNRTMREVGIDRENNQIVVVPAPQTVTNAFFRNSHGLAHAQSTRWADGEPDIYLIGEKPADHIYVVASLLDEIDYFMAAAIADHYKSELGAKAVTLVAPFMGFSRGDKNTRNGGYASVTVNIRTGIGMLANYVDRMMVIEPHSSATQCYAAEFGIPLAPLSPWQYMMENLQRYSSNELDLDINADTAVFVRPDVGRHLAAERSSDFLKIPSVSFTKNRISGVDVEVHQLSEPDQELVKGKTAVVYDDEAASMGTLYNIVKMLGEYDCANVLVCLAHRKFTPGWLNKSQHPLIKLIMTLDTRAPIGNIAMARNIVEVSAAPLIMDLIEADIKGVNFWQDPVYRSMVLQEIPDSFL